MNNDSPSKEKFSVNRSYNHKKFGHKHDANKLKTICRPFNPHEYLMKKNKEQEAAKTIFVNPELERLQKELELLKQQKHSIDILNREKRKQELRNAKPEVVVMNGDHYVVKGNSMDKVVSRPVLVKNKSSTVCLSFCKYGSCSNPSCPNIHDPKKIRICPAFLKGCCENENCKLSHTVNPDQLPLCSFFLNGRCTREGCNFRHEMLADSVPVCSNFNAGYCNKGSACKFKHVYTYSKIPSSTPSAPVKETSVSDINCFLPSFIKLGGEDK